MGESEHTLRSIIQKLNYQITDMSGNPVDSFELKEYIMVPSQTVAIQR
jgi:hypothetical protein